MGAITSGIGLISGINTTQLVNELMAVDQQPVTDLQSQITQLQTQESTWQALAAQLQALQTTAASFGQASTFQAVNATSSNPNVLTVTAQTGATPATYTITPVQLAANDQVVSSGVADTNTTPVGGGQPGTLSIQVGGGELNPPTSLAFLNGQSGVARGQISITDKAGDSAVVNLTDATTVQDVLDAINGTAGIDVAASVSGGHIVLTDTSAGGGQLSVAEVNGGTTAAGLGLLQSTTSSTLAGNDIVSVNDQTALGNLDDGNGIRTLTAASGGGDGGDIQLTLEDGTGLTVNLSGAKTVGNVINAINNASGNGGKLVASIDSNGVSLDLHDTTNGAVGPLTVAAVGASQAAQDLGLLGVTEGPDHTIHGQRLVAGLDSVLLRNLNGGSGVQGGTIDIQDRAGGSASVDLSGAQTVQDVLDAINGASGVSVHAGVNAAGDGITVTDTSGGSTDNFTISDTGSTTTAQDLNILHGGAGTSVNSGQLNLRYVSQNTTLASLNVAAGKFIITNSAGLKATVDLTGSSVKTIGDVINAIDGSGIGVTAAINSAGDGLLLTDNSGGAGQLAVREAGSTTATDLGIAGTAASGSNQLDGSLRINIAVSPTDTLQTIANEINAHSNVSAAIIDDGSDRNPYRLVISSKIGGLAGRMVLDSGTTGLAALNFTTLTSPQNALVFLGDPSNPNSIAVQSGSNTITGLANNVSLNLVAPSATPVTVSITGSTAALETQLSSFATQFNATVSAIAQDTAYDTSTNTASPLQGDVTAENIGNELFNLLTTPVSGATGNFQTLAQIGFSVTSNGTAIAFDQSQFEAAYAQDPAAVQALFTTASTGIGAQIQSLLTGLTDPNTGTIQTEVNSINTQVTDFNQQITDLNTRLTAERNRMLEQFANMESSLAQLQSEQQVLNGLMSTSTTASPSSTTSSLLSQLGASSNSSSSSTSGSSTSGS